MTSLLTWSEALQRYKGPSVGAQASMDNTGQQAELGTVADPDATARVPSVIVAMSGGVDSSVAAKLLIDKGYNVKGVTLKLTQEDGVSARYDACCGPEGQEDANRIARQLGFSHHLLAFETAFESRVVEPFCRGYLCGQTPNPCIECNRYQKFGALDRYRISLGFNYLATGHYARISHNLETGRYELRRAADPSKDQTYFLYTLTQDQLAHTLFPLGELTKLQVRDIAEQAGLVTAYKTESQDICFVPNGDCAAFVKERTGQTPTPGPIVDVMGRVLGEHRGLSHYTIGQRKGIGISSSEPLYVCAKRIDENMLVVGTRKDTLITRVLLQDVNFVSVSDFNHELIAQVKIRYRQQAQPAIVTQLETNNVEVRFCEPLPATAPGQAAVIYDGDRVLAGGTVISCS